MTFKLIEFFHFTVFEPFPPVDNFLRLPSEDFQSHVSSMMITLVIQINQFIKLKTKHGTELTNAQTTAVLFKMAISSK